MTRANADQLPPAERLAGRGKLLGHRAVILFGVQGAVFADGVAQQQFEDRPGRTIQLAVAMDQGAGPDLIVAADRRFRFGQQMRPGHLADLLQVIRMRPGLPVQEIAAPVHPVQRHLVRPQDQAGDRIAAVARPDHVSPGVGRIAGMHADRIAMDAPLGLVRLSTSAGSSTDVAEDQLIGRQGDRLADRLVRHPFGQGCGHGFGGGWRAGLEDRPAHALDPGVVRRTRSCRAAQELVLVEKSWQKRPRLVGTARRAASPRSLFTQ